MSTCPMCLHRAHRAFQCTQCNCELDAIEAYDAGGPDLDLDLSVGSRERRRLEGTLDADDDEDDWDEEEEDWEEDEEDTDDEEEARFDLLSDE